MLSDLRRIAESNPSRITGKYIGETLPKEAEIAGHLMRGLLHVNVEDWQPQTEDLWNQVGWVSLCESSPHVKLSISFGMSYLLNKNWPDSVHFQSLLLWKSCCGVQGTVKLKASYISGFALCNGFKHVSSAQHENRRSWWKYGYGGCLKGRVFLPFISSQKVWLWSPSGKCLFWAGKGPNKFFTQ